jgi:amidase
VLASPKISTADADRLAWLDAHDQAALVQKGEVSSLDLIDAAISRIERLEPKLNAIAWRAFETARERAAVSKGGGLAGVPYLVKDSLEYPGMPAFAGSRSRSDALGTKAYPYIKSFDAAGLIPVGKSTMPEFGLMPTTESLRFGATHNPWDLSRSAGGSSGGAGAAVAAGMVPLAHSSDAGGSIRIPAANCGVVGLKASRDANLRARTPHWLDDVLCSDGMTARSVRDVAWAFATSRPGGGAVVTEPLRERLTIAVVREGMQGKAPDPAVNAALDRTADLLASLGHRVEVIARPDYELGLIDTFMYDLWAYGGHDVVEYCRGAYPDKRLEDILDPWALGLAETCRSRTAADLERGYIALEAARQGQRTFYETVDVVLSPVISEPPAKLGRHASDREYEALLADMIDYMPYTQLQNMAGTPAISLPLQQTDEGVPIGMMLAAGFGRDDLLLQLSLELEAASPWKDRRPDLG